MLLREFSAYDLHSETFPRLFALLLMESCPRANSIPEMEKLFPDRSVKTVAGRWVKTAGTVPAERAVP